MNTPSHSNRGPERRIFERLSKILEVNYKVIKYANSKEQIRHSKPMSATTRNIGAGGIALDLKESIPLGSMIELKFELPGDPAPIFCLAEVLRSRQVENTIFCETVFLFLDLSPGDRERIKKFVVQGGQ